MHVSRLAVLPGSRGHGVGRRLMAWVEDEARRLGVRVLRGEVRTVLKDVLQYYRGYRLQSHRLHIAAWCAALPHLDRKEAPPFNLPSSDTSGDDVSPKADPLLEETAWVDEAALAPRLFTRC